jgi:hypothetical protein
MRRLAIALALLSPSLADASPRHRAARHAAPRPDDAEVAACVHGRTGPAGGISPHEAVQLCSRIARSKAKVAKAVLKARDAIEACEQAVSDACVDACTDTERGCDCTDASLAQEFAACGIAPGTEGK